MPSLSNRIRPQNIDEFVGQGHFLYKGSLLYNSIKNKTFDNAIFFGPSGTGKTTLARIIAREMDSDFVEINATNTGTKELKAVIEKAERRLFGFENKTTYVYVDEIHRWNKLQQDSLLKALEDGVLKFIGSTTENPYFSINNAVLSRVRHIYEFHLHSIEELEEILRRALDDTEVGLGNMKVACPEMELRLIASMSNGDGRVALDTLEFIVNNLRTNNIERNPKKGDCRTDSNSHKSMCESVNVFRNGEDEDDADLSLDLYQLEITEKIIQEAFQKQTYFFNKEEDKYNLLSALQKSVRGSDPDAAIHYLARLFEGGADIQTIGRRLMVMASEDVSMAYPNAITIVQSCVEAALMVGYPEAEINLAQGVILLAASPKSNSSYAALLKAKEDIRNRKIDDVPDHLKDSHYKGAKSRGLGIGYRYPHDFGGYVDQQYLPDNLYKEGTIYYEPSGNGSERSFKNYVENLRRRSRKDD